MNSFMFQFRRNTESSSNTVIMKFLVKRKSMLLFSRFMIWLPQLAVASVFAAVTCSALPQNRPERLLNVLRDRCFGRAKLFRNLLKNPPRNGECCLSHKIAARPRELDVCCRVFVAEAEEGGYLSHCPTVPRVPEYWVYNIESSCWLNVFLY